MIFATDPTIYDHLRDNIIWYHDNLDLLKLEDRTNQRARAVLDTYHDLSPGRATEIQVEAFNRACAQYRAGQAANL